MLIQQHAEEQQEKAVCNWSQHQNDNEESNKSCHIMCVRLIPIHRYQMQRRVNGLLGNN